MRLLLLGPPGSGKGTQAKRLCATHGMQHISTGDILRAAIAAQSPVGKQAEPYLSQGKLVPDDMVNQLVAERFSGQQRPKAFLLDGYPRTMAQAQVFDEILASHGERLDRVLRLMVDDDEIVRRISGRRVAVGSGAVYHVVFKPPKVPDRCDVTGEPLVQRPDDREATVRQRLEIYRAATLPLIDYYRAKGLLRDVPGTGTVEEVNAALARELPGD